MKFTDKKTWDKGLAKNTDPYGRQCYIYAKAWADLMEERMAKGEALADIAKETSREANTSGLTGFMYGCSVSILAQCWEHGDALRRWHNLDTQIGTEGEKANEAGGTLNPALLNIEVPE